MWKRLEGKPGERRVGNFCTKGNGKVRNDVGLRHEINNFPLYFNGLLTGSMYGGLVM
jgi:hypothetical protein